jgi:hypothetical protein
LSALEQITLPGGNRHRNCGTVHQTKGETMPEETPEKKITLEELMVSTLAMTDALAKLLIAKEVITDAEFKNQLDLERKNYLAVLKRLH